MSAEQEQDCDFLLKVLLVGFSEKKERLLLRYFEDSFSENETSIISAHAKVKTEIVNGLRIKLQITGLLHSALSSLLQSCCCC